jgi:hypothetical protein
MLLKLENGLLSVISSYLDFILMKCLTFGAFLQKMYSLIELENFNLI